MTFGIFIRGHFLCNLTKSSKNSQKWLKIAIFPKNSFLKVNKNKGFKGVIFPIKSQFYCSQVNMHKRGKFCVRANFDLNKRVKFLPQKRIKAIAPRHSVFLKIFKEKISWHIQTLILQCFCVFYFP